MTHGRVIAMLVVSSLLSSCSFVLVRPPAPRPGAAPCTRSRAAPVADTVIATGLFALGIVAAYTVHAVADDCNPDHGQDCSVPASVPLIGVGLGLAVASPFVASAAWGFHKTALCRERGEGPPAVAASGD